MLAISAARGAVPPQLLPVFQSVFVVPVHVLVAANREIGKTKNADKMIADLIRLDWNVLKPFQPELFASMPAKKIIIVLAVQLQPFDLIALIVPLQLLSLLNKRLITTTTQIQNDLIIPPLNCKTFCLLYFIINWIK